MVPIDPDPESCGPLSLGLLLLGQIRHGLVQDAFIDGNEVPGFRQELDRVCG